jgi:hypothetical protein
MPLPEAGTQEYEDMIDFMRADLESGMKYTKIEMEARKLIKERGGDFDEEFAKWKKTKSYGHCPYNYSGFDANKSTCQECVEEVNIEDKEVVLVSLPKTREADTLLIIVWPDGTWCHEELSEEYNWKSDDYKTLKVPDNLSDEEIDVIVLNNF